MRFGVFNVARVIIIIPSLFHTRHHHKWRTTAIITWHIITPSVLSFGLYPAFDLLQSKGSSVFNGSEELLASIFGELDCSKTLVNIYETTQYQTLEITV